MDTKEFDEVTETLNDCINDAMCQYIKISDTSNDEQSCINVVTINGQRFKGLSARTIMKIRLALYDDADVNISTWQGELDDHLKSKIN